MREPTTIITTVRDGDKFLERYFANVASILGASDRAIIVDDGSKIPVSGPTEDDRISIYRAEPIGRGAALNLAISKSTTDLIAIQDIDDTSLPDRLERQVAFLRKHQNTLLFTRTLSDPWLPTLRVQNIAPTRLYLGNPLHHSSLSMYRSVWDSAGGYDEDLNCCTDLDFYLRAASRLESKLCRLDRALIERNLVTETRHFANIPNGAYQTTRQMVLERYRSALPSSFWLCCADIKQRFMASGGAKS